MLKNNFCDASEVALNVHQSAKNSVDFPITEVVRKNFYRKYFFQKYPCAINQSINHGKNQSIPVQELR